MYKKDKRRVSVAFDPEIDDRIELLAARSGVSKNALINSLLLEALYDVDPELRKKRDEEMRKLKTI